MHDGRCLALEDTVEFFNLVLTLQLTNSERKDLTVASVAMRLKVVVVDDEPDFCKSESLLVESLGHEAHAFPSGRDVLETVEKLRPHLILSDLSMPQMDGFELARRLRQTAAGKQAVLVAITGLADEEHRQLVVRAGFDFRLVKPVSIEELRWLLEEVVVQLGAR